MSAFRLSSSRDFQPGLCDGTFYAIDSLKILLPGELQFSSTPKFYIILILKIKTSVYISECSNRIIGRYLFLILQSYIFAKIFYSNALCL